MSDSNVSEVTDGVATLTIAVPTNACSGLLQFPTQVGRPSTPSSSQTITVTASWGPDDIRPTVMTFSGFVLTTDNGGDPGFAFPGAGHRARVVGSFSGDDHGAMSVASVFANQATSEIARRCSTLSGLASIPITSGEVTFA